MNQIAWQIYGGSNRKANTFIGGVSSTITTSGALATKLGIASNRITNFKIVGSDIECRISGSYSIPANAFNNDINITSFVDSDGLVTDLGNIAFKFNAITGSKIKKLEFKGIINLTGIQVITDTSVEELYLENCVSIASNAFVYDTGFSKNKLYYIPLCTSLGSSVLDNSVFTNISNGCLIICHPSLATNNAGAPDGDIAYAISQGATIRYKTNTTAPNPITNLTAGSIYNTAIQLNFTPPTGSANSIEYYECYSNGVFKNRITGSGQYITGLTPNTNYNITIKAVDIFFNKSVASNNVNQSTNTTSAVPTTGLVSYYKLDANSNDSFGSNNGTDTSVSYVAGKVSNAGSYNGSTSVSSMGNPASLQLSSGSVSCWIKASASGASDRGIIGKNEAYMLFLRDGVLGLYSWGAPSGFKTTGINLNDNAWHNIVLVFESGTNKNYIYIDNVLRLTFSMSVSNQTQTFKIGYGGFTGQYINALIDEASVYNVKLSPVQIDLLYNSGNGTTL